MKSNESQTGQELNRGEQSQADKVRNFETAAAQVAEKLETRPQEVTKEEAATLHSRERRAYGDAEKGGIAAYVRL